MADEAQVQTLDDVVGRLQRTIGEDDYSIVATVVDPGSVDLQVLARDEACVECLVPKDMMRLIADNFLAEIDYRVRGLAYPDDPAPDADADARL